jgi:hypothetical protein
MDQVGYPKSMSIPQPPETTEAPGPVPADNQPGHHPSKEQDKPDLTAFAQKLGVTEQSSDLAAGEDRPGRSKAVAVALAVMVALLALFGVAWVRRRRSRR